MEAIPETREAVDEYGPFASDGLDLVEELRTSSLQVQDLVPECIGITLCSTSDGVSFTLVSTDDEVAVLDAIQYTVGGPCVESVRAEQVLAYTQDDFLDEAGWQLFAQATSAACIESTLTLPIVVDGTVAGSVNLYASTGNAFTDRHEQLAEIFGAWAPGAVTNADLAFSTRKTAERAPLILREQVRIQVALGVLMKDQGLDVETAWARLTEAAHRAGATVAMLAEQLASNARPRNDEVSARWRATGPPRGDGPAATWLGG